MIFNNTVLPQKRYLSLKSPKICHFKNLSINDCIPIIVTTTTKIFTPKIIKTTIIPANKSNKISNQTFEFNNENNNDL